MKKRQNNWKKMKDKIFNPLFLIIYSSSFSLSTRDIIYLLLSFYFKVGISIKMRLMINLTEKWEYLKCEVDLVN